jgi:hypothetical protein
VASDEQDSPGSPPPSIAEGRGTQRPGRHHNHPGACAPPVFIKDKIAYLQAGAGIVADSVPAREYDECLNKARAVLRAFELAEKGL